MVKLFEATCFDVAQMHIARRAGRRGYPNIWNEQNNLMRNFEDNSIDERTNFACHVWRHPSTDINCFLGNLDAVNKHKIQSAQMNAVGL